MRVGKVKESILKRSVLRQLHNQNTGNAPQIGVDAGMFPVPKGSMKDTLHVAVSVNPVEGWTQAPRRAVYGAVNSLAAAGARPESVAAMILMPEGTEEKQLKGLIKEMDELCEKEGIRMISGHTAVSPFVRTLVISMTAVGIREDKQDGCRKEKNGHNKKKWTADFDIVAIGTAAAEGTAMIAQERQDELLSRYPASYIEEAKHLFDDGSMSLAADTARSAGAVYIHDVREGGIFAGLWELAAVGKVGLNIDLKQIPIKQHTIEVCEFFHLNPYMLRSGGALLTVCPQGEKLAEKLRQEGIPAAVIGRTTEGNDRIIRYDDEIRFLEPPKSDEYYRICR